MVINLKTKFKKQTKSIVFKISFIFMVLSCSAIIINTTAKAGENQTIGKLNQSFKSPNDWTILVYLDADNNLESYGIDDFMEMSSVGSDANIHIVVQFDRSPDYNTLYDNWNGTKRYHIDPGETPTIANAVMDLGEVNMGNASSLSEFITWGTTNYAANHYALILWNHGSGWKSADETPDPLFKGVCYDETSGDDCLNNTELKNALATAGIYFDIIAFDACLMAMAEIDYQIKDWAQVCVASEESIPGDGFPYNAILGHLQTDPTMNTSTLGTIMVDDYINYYGIISMQSLSAINLTQVSALATAVNTLSSELISQITTFITEIQYARGASETTLDVDYIDLYNFVNEIYSRISDINIQNAALDVLNNISLMTINEAHGIGHPGYNGTSIYYPSISSGYNSDYNTTLDFTADTLWDEFLQTYYVNVPDDNYEENDYWDEAYDLSLNESTWLSSINGSGVQLDNDWYEIYVDPGYEFLQVRLTFSDIEGNIDIDLYESDGTSNIASSTSTTDNESIFYEVSIPGTYYLSVYGDNAGNAYDLWWNDTIVPTDDNYEENDYWYQAYDLSSYEATWLSSINGSGVQLDDDWYEIYVSSGSEHLQVNLTFSHAEGDIDLGVYDWVSDSIIATSISVTDNEYIDYILPDYGIYYLLVYYKNAGNAYDLWWDDIMLFPDDPDDNYEENDDWDEAYDLSSNEATWLSTINGFGVQLDDDWYEIYIDPGYERLQVNLTFNDAEGDIDLRVYASNGSSIVTSSTSTTDNEYIDYEVPTSGTYYLLIYWEDAGNNYDLWWNDTMLLLDDNYEENDHWYEAYDLSSNEATWLSSINGTGVQYDDDWYEIYVDPGYERLQVNLTFNNAEGDIDLRVYDSNGYYIIVSSISNTDNESIDFVVSNSGVYYLRIYYDDAGNEYDLIWSCLEYTSVIDERLFQFLPGYDLLFLFGALIAISLIIIRKLRTKNLEF